MYGNDRTKRVLVTMTLTPATKEKFSGCIGKQYFLQEQLKFNDWPGEFVDALPGNGIMMAIEY